MVSYKEIQSSNSLLNTKTLPRVSVFVGATSGIGKYTLKALVAASAGTQEPIRIYVTCRLSSVPAAEAFISSDLRPLNPQADISCIVGEVSLLSEVRRVCALIRFKEPLGIDLLFLSAGYAPAENVRNETAEGIEVGQSLEYYSRILFIKELSALLNKHQGRVVSVLGGGLEKPSFIPDVDDLDLKNPGGSGVGVMGYKAQSQYLAMNTLGMEVLARENPGVTFLHSWPGIVSTGNVWRGVRDRNSWMGWVIWLLIEPLIRFWGTSEEECGQRFLFQCTSGYYGGNKSERAVEWSGKKGVSTEEGLFLVDYNCECTPNEANVKALREKAQTKVWEHTMEVLAGTENRVGEQEQD
ncbi:hypothetical protein QBC44DRAFT_318423 [Cladorrhinum sp. PSN332]|nr:hypothetical protein QBC44DRAFT_318423 [Cladorrhinum sp. PSN332]